jgi:hypothetical protein
MTIQAQGTLTPDGTIILDAKPALPPGRVSVRVEPLEASVQNAERLPSDNNADWDAAMKAANELQGQGRWEEIDRLVEKNAILYPGPDVGVDIIREMRDSRHFQGDE